MSFICLESKISGQRIIFYSTPELRSLARLRKKVKLSSQKLKYNIFLTLTFRDRVKESQASKYVRLFMNRYKTYYRKYCKDNNYEFTPRNFAYIWKLERGEKKGRVHVHVLLTAHYIPQDKVKGWWKSNKKTKKIVKYKKYNSDKHKFTTYATNEVSVEMKKQLKSLGWVKIKKITTPVMVLNYINKYFSKNAKLNEYNMANRRFGVSKEVNQAVKNLKSDEWFLMKEYQIDEIKDPKVMGEEIDYWNHNVADIQTKYDQRLPKMWKKEIEKQKKLI